MSTPNAPHKTKRAPPPLLKGYLIAYNTVSTLGWAYVLVLTVAHLANYDGRSLELGNPAAPTASTALSRLLASVFKTGAGIESRIPEPLRPLFRRTGTTFARVGATTAAVQTAATLEVVHVLLGWVRSPLATTAMQVASRLFLVWGIAEQFPVAQASPLYASMVVAWATTEVIRYSFYAFNLLGREPRVLLWLRYTTFFLLYPLGAGSEAFLIYSTLPSSSPYPSFRSWVRGLWGPTDYVRGALFLIWWPGLYVMYTYMIQQRRKVLGAGAGRKLKSN